MSGFVVGWAFRHTELTPVQKLVLLAYADNSDDDGKCWPGKQTIIKKTGLSPASVYRAIKELKTSNLMVESEDEKHRSCVWLAVPVSQGDDAVSHSENPFSHTETPYIDEPSKEPSDEPSKRLPVNESSGIERVWASYVAIFNPRRKVLDPDARRLINKVLKVATADEAIVCVEECMASDWHQMRGADANRSGRKRRSLTDIFQAKNGTTQRGRVDFWLDKREDRRKGGPASDAGSDGLTTNQRAAAQLRAQGLHEEADQLEADE